MIRLVLACLFLDYDLLLEWLCGVNWVNFKVVDKGVTEELYKLLNFPFFAEIIEPPN
jgi:hypothetical protein